MKEPFAFNVSVPCVGGATTSAVSTVPASGSVSLPSTPGAATLRGVSSVAVKASAAATGGSLTFRTVIVTVAAAALGSGGVELSTARYVKVTVPEKPAAGLYEKLPFGLRDSVPLAGNVTSSAISAPFSASVSLASTPAAGTVSSTFSLVS